MNRRAAVNKMMIGGALVLLIIIVGYVFFSGGAETGGKFTQTVQHSSGAVLKLSAPASVTPGTVFEVVFEVWNVSNLDVVSFQYDIPSSLSITNSPWTCPSNNPQMTVAWCRSFISLVFNNDTNHVTLNIADSVSSTDIRRNPSSSRKGLIKVNMTSSSAGPVNISLSKILLGDTNGNAILRMNSLAGGVVQINTAPTVSITQPSLATYNLSEICRPQWQGRTVNIQNENINLGRGNTEPVVKINTPDGNFVEFTDDAGNTRTDDEIWLASNQTDSYYWRNATGSSTVYSNLTSPVLRRSSSLSSSLSWINNTSMVACDSRIYGSTLRAMQSNDYWAINTFANASDPDGDNLTYVWNISVRGYNLSGSPWSRQNFFTSVNDSPEHTFSFENIGTQFSEYRVYGVMYNNGMYNALKNSTWNFTVTVTDPSGASASDSIYFDITNTTNTRPTVNLTSPVNNKWLAGGSNLAVSASGSDSDGSISYYKWRIYNRSSSSPMYTNNTTASYTIRGDSASFGVTYSILNTPGKYKLSVVAVDNLGGESLPDEITFYVDIGDVNGDNNITVLDITASEWTSTGRVYNGTNNTNQDAYVDALDITATELLRAVAVN
jgi:hypothetical protein